MHHQILFLLALIHPILAITQDASLNISQSLSNIAYQTMLSQISQISSDPIYFTWIDSIDYEFRKNIPDLIQSGIDAFDQTLQVNVNSRNRVVSDTLHAIQTQFIKTSKQVIHSNSKSKRYFIHYALLIVLEISKI